LGNGDGTFQQAQSYGAGRSPFSVAVGDFNGDGKPDLAVANVSSNNVSILLGNGDGSFQQAVNYAAGSSPRSVAVGDFNGDGKLDLAVANSGVSVLLGNGDGTFQTARNFPAGSTPLSVSVGDFNGDGKLDLAVANYDHFGSGTVSVLLGNGDGSFGSARSFAAGTRPFSVAVGDFNGDGRPDLAVTNRDSDNVSVLVANGDGSFQQAVNYAAGSSPRSVAVGDFDGDGLLDLAVANFGSDNVSVLLGNGDGTFQTAQSYAAGSHPWSVAVGDFNGDGLPDLAVAHTGSANVSVLLGNGDGSFQTARNFPAQGTNSVAVGDFNGDGFLDLVTTGSVLLGNGDGSFQAARNFPTGSAPQSVAVGDFNGDGLLDLAVANNRSNDVSVLLGNGDGTFQATRNFPAGIAPWSVAVGDFNGDGLLDLAVAGSYCDYGSCFDQTVRVLLGNGDGTFQTARNFPAGSAPRSVAVGDFNGDGLLDLAVANEGTWPNFRDGSVSVLLGNGDGSFRFFRDLAAGYGPQSVAVADLNGDGLLDLVVASGTVRVLLGNGDGSFQTTHVSYVAGGFPSSAAVADFDGDGFPDLAVANYGSNDVSVLLNDGIWRGPSPPPGGGRLPHAVPRPGTSPVSLALAVADLVRPGPGVPATAPPFGAALPSGDVHWPLLDAAAAKGQSPAAGAVVPAPQPPGLVLARAERTARGLVDRLFTAWESSWLDDRAAGTLGLLWS
jgi:hypothetical protein